MIPEGISIDLINYVKSNYGYTQQEIGFLVNMMGAGGIPENNISFLYFVLGRVIKEDINNPKEMFLKSMDCIESLVNVITYEAENQKDS